MVGSNRGRIEHIKLKQPFVLNSNSITEAVIEIDHINFGLNPKTGTLNKSRRTNFSVADIEKFLMLLNGEYIAARDYKGKVSRFEIRINCPIKGQFSGRQFILVFDTDYSKPNEIHTITLYPGWKR